MLFVDDLLVLHGVLAQAPEHDSGGDFGRCFCFGAAHRRDVTSDTSRSDGQVLCFNEGRLVEGREQLATAAPPQSIQRPSTSWG